MVQAFNRLNRVASQDFFAKLGWPAIGIVVAPMFPVTNTASFAEEGKDQQESLCCCLRPPCVTVDPSDDARRDKTNEEVNSATEQQSPCGAPGSDGNPLIAITPGIRSCAEIVVEVREPASRSIQTRGSANVSNISKFKLIFGLAQGKAEGNGSSEPVLFAKIWWITDEIPLGAALVIMRPRQIAAQLPHG